MEGTLYEERPQRNSSNTNLEYRFSSNHRNSLHFLNDGIANKSRCCLHHKQQQTRKQKMFRIMHRKQQQTRKRENVPSVQSQRRCQELPQPSQFRSFAEWQTNVRRPMILFHRRLVDQLSTRRLLHREDVLWIEQRNRALLRMEPWFGVRKVVFLPNPVSPTRIRQFAGYLQQHRLYSQVLAVLLKYSNNLTQVFTFYQQPIHS